MNESFRCDVPTGCGFYLRKWEGGKEAISFTAQARMILE